MFPAAARGPARLLVGPHWNERATILLLARLSLYGRHVHTMNDGIAL